MALAEHCKKMLIKRLLDPVVIFCARNCVFLNCHIVIFSTAIGVALQIGITITSGVIENY